MRKMMRKGACIARLVRLVRDLRGQRTGKAGGVQHHMRCPLWPVGVRDVL